jgi:hypothetical protein
MRWSLFSSEMGRWNAVSGRQGPRSAGDTDQALAAQGLYNSLRSWKSQLDTVTDWPCAMVARESLTPLLGSVIGLPLA